MEWKQIEAKWAAMARRIRADAQCRDLKGPVRHTGMSEATSAAATQQVAGANTTGTKKLTSVSTH
jgi:hypothetical protein